MELDSNELTVPYRTFSRFRASLAQIHKHAEHLKKLTPLLKSQASTLRRRRKLTAQVLHFSQSTSTSLASTLSLLQQFDGPDDPNGVLHINSAHEYVTPHESVATVESEYRAGDVNIGAAPTVSVASLSQDSPDVALAVDQCHSLEPTDCADCTHNDSEAGLAEVESSVESDSGESVEESDDEWI